MFLLFLYVTYPFYHQENDLSI